MATLSWADRARGRSADPSSSRAKAATAASSAQPSPALSPSVGSSTSRLSPLPSAASGRPARSAASSISSLPSGPTGSSSTSASAPPIPTAQGEAPRPASDSVSQTPASASGSASASDAGTGSQIGWGESAASESSKPSANAVPLPNVWATRRAEYERRKDAQGAATTLTEPKRSTGPSATPSTPLSSAASIPPSPPASVSASRSSAKASTSPATASSAPLPQVPEIADSSAWPAPSEEAASQKPAGAARVAGAVGKQESPRRDVPGLGPVTSASTSPSSTTSQGGTKKSRWVSIPAEITYNAPLPTNYPASARAGKQTKKDSTAASGAQKEGGKSGKSAKAGKGKTSTASSPIDTKVKDLSIDPRPRDAVSPAASAATSPTTSRSKEPTSASSTSPMSTKRQLVGETAPIVDVASAATSAVDATQSQSGSTSAQPSIPAPIASLPPRPNSPPSELPFEPPIDGSSAGPEASKVGLRDRDEIARQLSGGDRPSQGMPGLFNPMGPTYDWRLLSQMYQQGPPGHPSMPPYHQRPPNPAFAGPQYPAAGPQNGGRGNIPKISATIQPPPMHLTAGPMGVSAQRPPYPAQQSGPPRLLAHSQSHSSTSTSSLTSSPQMPNFNQRELSITSPGAAALSRGGSDEPPPLHVNAPQGNVMVSDPLVTSDGSTPVFSSSGDSAALVWGARSPSEGDRYNPQVTESRGGPSEPMSRTGSGRSKGRGGSRGDRSPDKRAAGNGHDQRQGPPGGSNVPVSSGWRDQSGWQGQGSRGSGPRGGYRGGDRGGRGRGGFSDRYNDRNRQNGMMSRSPPLQEYGSPPGAGPYGFTGYPSMPPQQPPFWPASYPPPDQYYQPPYSPQHAMPLQQQQQQHQPPQPPPHSQPLGPQPQQQSYTGGPQYPYYGQPYYPPVAPPMPQSQPPPQSFEGRPIPTLQQPVQLDPTRYYLLGQVEYYLTNVDNLVKDTFLRSQMDSEGWVKIETIANFNRIKSLSQDVDLICDTLTLSALLEVDVTRKLVRNRHDWKTWLLPKSGETSSQQASTAPQPLSPPTSQVNGRDKQLLSGSSSSSERGEDDLRALTSPGETTPGSSAVGGIDILEGEGLDAFKLDVNAAVKVLPSQQGQQPRIQIGNFDASSRRRSSVSRRAVTH